MFTLGEEDYCSNGIMSLVIYHLLHNHLMSDKHFNANCVSFVNVRV